MEETFNIDIVEDDEGSVRALGSMLARYGKEAGVQFTVRTFADGFAFICDYDGSADVVFMDIEMPNLNGLDAARKLRRVDGSAVLVFITNLAQYAINGYEVDATDFIVKPLAWPSFSLKLKKILHTCARRRAASVRLDTQEGQVVLERGEIYYAESDKHYVTFHTARGNFRVRMSMAEAEAAFKDYNFARCSTSFLVNLARVTRIRRDSVSVGGEELPLSRTKKQSFLDALTLFTGGN